MYTAWIEALTALKKFTERSGHGILDQLIHDISQFDRAMKDRDLSALECLYIDTAKKTGKLVQHIKNRDIAKIWSNTSNECALLAKKIANGATVEDVANFEKEKAKLIFSAVN